VFLVVPVEELYTYGRTKHKNKMPLLAISLLISTLFSAVIIKTTDYSAKQKQPISNRRHAGGRNGLLDINKDLSV
jgi:hypothetical protein